MKLSLYTNSFIHGGARHVSVSVMVYRDTEIVGSFGSTTYATVESQFDAAFQAVSTARSLAALFERMGQEIEVEAGLENLDAVLERLYREVRA